MILYNDPSVRNTSETQKLLLGMSRCQIRIGADILNIFTDRGSALLAGESR